MSPFCLNVKVQIRPDQVRNVEFPQTPKVRQQSGCSTKDTLLVSVAVFLLTTPLIHTTLRLHDTEREVSGVHQSRPERLHPDRTCLPPVCGWRRYNESQRLLLSRRVRKWSRFQSSYRDATLCPVAVLLWYQTMVQRWWPPSWLLSRHTRSQKVENPRLCLLFKCQFVSKTWSQRRISQSHCSQQGGNRYERATRPSICLRWIHSVSWHVSFPRAIHRRGGWKGGVWRSCGSSSLSRVGGICQQGCVSKATRGKLFQDDPLLVVGCRSQGLHDNRQSKNSLLSKSQNSLFYWYHCSRKNAYAGQTLQPTVKWEGRIHIRLMNRQVYDWS